MFIENVETGKEQMTFVVEDSWLTLILKVRITSIKYHCESFALKKFDITCFSFGRHSRLFSQNHRSFALISINGVSILCDIEGFLHTRRKHHHIK